MGTRTNRARALCALAALLVCGCARGGQIELVDAGIRIDQGIGLDAEMTDSGPNLDAPPPDASDGALGIDAGPCPTGYSGPGCAACAAGYQDKDMDDVCTPACGSPGVCDATLGCDDSSGSPMCAACPLAPGAELAWTIDLPTRPNWNMLSEIVYASDNRASLASFAWTRIGYCLVLDSNAAYVEMDDYTASTLAHVALPMDWIYDQHVANLTVASTLESVTDATRVATGTIEMWSDCYATGADGLFDADDEVGASAHCYGSFQVHNAGNTVIAWNGWSYVTGDSSVGIGNDTTSTTGTDWTNVYNASVYVTRQLSAYLVP
ncbi:MAG: hypothetical protein IPK60_20110 [Sandaracinaceae bacterium]|nr:hypothetical protein [Sandaracinaceae bacterium]